MNKRIISWVLTLVMTISLLSAAAVSAFAAEEEEKYGEVKYENGKWVYYDPDGKLDPHYTGVGANAAGLWFVDNGVVDFKTNGVRYANIDKSGLYDFLYFEQSRATEHKVSYINPGKYENDGIIYDFSGGWYYFGQFGLIDLKFTGFAPNSAGLWYVKEGEVTFKETGVIHDPNSQKPLDDWYNVKNNKVTPGPTVSYNAAGWWYIDKSGKVDFKANTVAYNAAGWWACQNGKVTFKFNGLASNDAGTWVCQNSKVNFNYNGTYRYNGRTYGIKGGKVV